MHGERPMPLAVGFDAHHSGPYCLDLAQGDWGASRLHGFCEPRTEIAADGVDGRCLRVLYPRGQIGTAGSGAEFKVWLDDAPAYYCDYRVLFESGFDFRCKGGKLPGLAGGTATTGGDCPTGDGWSSRYMWREEGHLFLYVYHLHQPGKYGEYFPLGTAAAPDRWYRLTQRIRVNDAGLRNGEAQVWVDGALKLDRRDFEFRTGDLAPVNRFLFSTFFRRERPRLGTHRRLPHAVRRLSHQRRPAGRFDGSRKVDRKLGTTWNTVPDS